MKHIVVDRRTVLAGGLSLLAAAKPAVAQGQPLTAAKLDKIIAEALRDGTDTKYERPGFLGFQTAVVFRQVARGAEHYFAVAVPQVDDGLLFYRGTPQPLLWLMHRTGRHLRRIISVRNIDGTLSDWSGSSADRDFLAQLEHWNRNA